MIAQVKVCHTAFNSAKLAVILGHTALVGIH